MTISLVKVKSQISGFNPQNEPNNLLDFFKQLCSDFDEIGFQTTSNPNSLADRQQQRKDLQQLREKISSLDQYESHQNFIGIYCFESR